MNNKFNYWPYLLIAGIILVVGAIAPYLFSKLSWGIIEFGDQTGPIGDTIGGITAPFLSLVGSILVFAALRAQIQANDIVLDQFSSEKESAKLESINKIELLSIDLDSVIKDIELRTERMKGYYEKEREKPFEINILKRTSSRIYSRLLEFERLSIYKGFKEFTVERDEWILHYNKLYRIFDYLPEYFDSVYLIYDLHVKDIFDQKMALRSRLIDLMNMSAKFTEAYKMKHSILKPESMPIWAAVNKLMSDYQEVIDESIEQSGKLIKETDFEKISNHVLLGFISRVMEIREKSLGYESEVHPMIELSAEIRRNIELIRQRATEFSGNIEEEHKKIVVDKEDEKSTLTQIKTIKAFIDTEIGKLNSEENEPRKIFRKKGL